MADSILKLKVSDQDIEVVKNGNDDFDITITKTDSIGSSVNTIRSNKYDVLIWLEAFEFPEETVSQINSVLKEY
jgi:hypothetical protein